MTSIPFTHTGRTTAAKLAELGVPIICGRLDSSGNPDSRDLRWKGWNSALSGSRSMRAASAWKEGEALAAVTGVVYDVLDIDPRNGGRESLTVLSSELGDSGPDIYWKIRTPRGGLHLYVAPLGIGSHNGFLPGLDLKGGRDDGSSRGFVFLPPTVRFNRRYKEIESGGLPGEYSAALSDFILRELEKKVESDMLNMPNVPNMSNTTSGRKPAEELRREVLEASSGQQRFALLRYVYELEKEGLEERDILSQTRSVLREIENFDPRNPWYPARGADADKWIRGLLHAPGVVIGDARRGELDGIADSEPEPEPVALFEDFWTARAELEHIRSWARARRAGPWAVLGECLAQAVCHVSPCVQLPPLVGGNGSLNMLIALTGPSGAGKSSARPAAQKAFFWEGSGEIPDVIPLFPLGSGEGLVKNFGFYSKAEGLVRTSWSAIVTIAEIDTYLSLAGRSGSTLSPQLRQLYSGEDIGFGYSDPAKRVVIPGHSYRSCVIAGVQPGRGAAILDDSESGFAQRWLWLPSWDRGAGDSSDPPFRSWTVPESLAFCSEGGHGLGASPEERLYGADVRIMGVCAIARKDIDSARLRVLRRNPFSEGGESESMREALDAHALYTRLKVAAGLALLSNGDSVSVEDWELAGIVLGVSDLARAGTERHLASLRSRENISRGRAEGIRQSAAREAAAGRDVRRVCAAVLNLVGSDWVSAGKLRVGVCSRDRELISEALDVLLSVGKIEVSEVVYRGQKGVKYRRI